MYGSIEKERSQLIIVLVGHSKGGVGKSTLATNLAVLAALQGADVLLVDADVGQASSAGWAALRDSEGLAPRIPSVQKSGNLIADVRDLAGRYDHVVVDAGGRDSTEIRSALMVADRLVMPLLPSQFDLWASDEMGRTLEEANAMRENTITALAVINRSPTHPLVKEASEARAYLSDLGVKLLPRALSDRRAYRRAVTEGKGVVEVKPRDASACNEVHALYDEVFL